MLTLYHVSRRIRVILGVIWQRIGGEILSMGAIQATDTDASFKLALDVLDIDEIYPSLKISIELIAPHPTGHFAYSANGVWFAASALADFMAALTLIGHARNATASLGDFSEYFHMTVINVDGNYSTSIRAHKPKTGLTSGDLSVTCTVDRDMVQFMLAAFRSLPTLKPMNAK